MDKTYKTNADMGGVHDAIATAFPDLKEFLSVSETKDGINIVYRGDKLDAQTVAAIDVIVAGKPTKAPPPPTVEERLAALEERVSGLEGAK